MGAKAAFPRPPGSGGLFRVTPLKADREENTMTTIETALLVSALARVVTAIAAVVTARRAK
jgi:hypothetical protein